MELHQYKVVPIKEVQVRWGPILEDITSRYGGTVPTYITTKTEQNMFTSIVAFRIPFRAGGSNMKTVRCKSLEHPIAPEVESEAAAMVLQARDSAARKRCKDRWFGPARRGPSGFQYITNFDSNCMYGNDLTMKAEQVEHLQQILGSDSPDIKFYVCAMNKTFTSSTNKMYFSVHFTTSFLLPFLNPSTERLRLRLAGTSIIERVRLVKGTDGRAANNHYKLDPFCASSSNKTRPDICLRVQSSQRQAPARCSPTLKTQLKMQFFMPPQYIKASLSTCKTHLFISQAPYFQPAKLLIPALLHLLPYMILDHGPVACHVPRCCSLLNFYDPDVCAFCHRASSKLASSASKPNRLGLPGVKHGSKKTMQIYSEIAGPANSALGGAQGRAPAPSRFNSPCAGLGHSHLLFLIATFLQGSAFTFK